MRSFAWIIGLLLCTVYGVQAQDRVIERPPFLAWSSNSIEIDKIFMGDTGSLAIGGAISTVAIILEQPLLIIIVGGVYVFETLSVIIQVTYFKLTGKRVFKMAPVHHHFEKCGWSEIKIVTVFSLITAVLCLIGFLAL